MRTLDRRAFLQGITATAVASTGCASTLIEGGEEGASLANEAAPRDAIDLAAPDAVAFPYGVMAGDMIAETETSARAILWTRFAGTTGAGVRLRVRAVLDGTIAFEADVPVADGGFVHVDVQQLKPGTRYEYRFYSGSSVSDRGTVMTPPALEAMPVLQVGVAACTHQYGPGGWQAIAHAATLELDAFVHLGDHVYNDAERWLITLDEFRTSYRSSFELPYMRAFHAKHGIYFTWDDHEIINNWDWDWVNAFPQYRPSVVNGTRAFFEHHPLRRDPSSPERLWRRVRFGKTAEMFILDLRSERREDFGRKMMSREQIDWLKQSLTASAAMFKLVMNPIPIATMPPADAHRADRWEGFESARTEVLAHIRDQHLEGVWWISGDYHVGAAGMIDPYGYRWYGMREVMMGPGAGKGAVTETRLMSAHVESTSGEKQWSFTSDRSNFLVLTLDPTTKTVAARFHDGAGAVIEDKTYPGLRYEPPARPIDGRIAAKHLQKKDILGDPLTKAHPTRDGVGRWQQFRWGYIYEHPSAGAFELHGPILDVWASQGWSQGELGYPTSDVVRTSSGKDQQTFQNGVLTFDPATGVVS